MGNRTKYRRGRAPPCKPTYSLKSYENYNLIKPNETIRN